MSCSLLFRAITHQREGANREIKKAVEAYWGGKLSADELTKAAADVKKTSWASLKERGVTLIPRSVSTCAVSF